MTTRRPSLGLPARMALQKGILIGCAWKMPLAVMYFLPVLGRPGLRVHLWTALLLLLLQQTEPLGLPLSYTLWIKQDARHVRRIRYLTHLSRLADEPSCSCCKPAAWSSCRTLRSLRVTSLLWERFIPIPMRNSCAGWG